jgi:signal transduction histidine kinase
VGEPGRATTEPVAAIDLIATTLAGLEESAPSSDFYGRLCEAICASVGLERAVVFGYDADLRRVQPQGSYGLALEVFAEAYVDPDTASFVRDALEGDRVVEAVGAPLLEQAPSAFRPLAHGRRAVCVPMTAAGRWVGVVLADRADSAPPLTADEREVLWTLGKGIALATMARRATRKDDRMQELQQRIDLAREVHDGAIQHLFGVSLALEGEGPLAAEARVRCAAEVQAALLELRRVVNATEPRAPLLTTVAETVARWGAAHADLDLIFDAGSADDVPPHLAHLVHTTLSEALRNVRKHCQPTAVVVRTQRIDGALVVEVENDGALVADGPASTGMGLRLLGIEALRAGGVLESGPRDGGRWIVRLVVPAHD